MKLRSRTPFLVWVFFIGVTSWYVFTYTKISTELSLLLPQGNTPQQNLLVDQLRQGVTSRLLLLGIQGGDLKVRTYLGKALVERMRESNDFAQVYCGDKYWMTSQEKQLFPFRYLLSHGVNTNRFSVASLHASLEKRLEDLVSPLSSMVKRYLPSDPTGEYVNIIAHWIPSSGPIVHNGVWVSSDKQMAMMMAETSVAGFDLEAQQGIQKWVRGEFQKFIDPLAFDPPPVLIMTGPAVFAVQSREQIAKEAKWLSIGGTLFVGLILYSLYRSGSIVLLCLVPLFSGVVVGVALVNVFFGYIHGVTLAFGITLIGVAVDHPIHLFTHVTPQITSHEALSKIWPTLRLGLLTTIIGYGALLFSGIPGLTQLGIFAIIGLLTSVMVTRWIIPTLIPQNYSCEPALSPIVGLIGWLPQLKILLPFLVVLSMGVLVFSVNPLWEKDLAKLSPISLKQRDLDQWLREELAGPDVRHMVIIEGATEEESLQRSETVIPLFNRLVEEGEIGGFDLAARYLPSQSTQRERQKSLPETSELKARLGKATLGLPFKPNLFQPFLREVETARIQDLITKSRFHQTPLGVKLDSLLFNTNERWIALIPLQNVKNPNVVQVEIAGQQMDGVYYFDIKEESEKIIGNYRRAMLGLLAWGGGCLVGVLLLGLRSADLSFRVLFPVFVSVCVLLALLHGFGQQLSLFHLASLLLVVGLGLDYGLFFQRIHKSGEDFNRTVQSLVVCCLTTVTVFGLLALSHYPVLKAIGATTALGALLCLVFSGMMVSTHRLIEPRLPGDVG